MSDPIKAVELNRLRAFALTDALAARASVKCDVGAFMLYYMEWMGHEPGTVDITWTQLLHATNDNPTAANYHTQCLLDSSLGEYVFRFVFDPIGVFVIEVVKHNTSSTDTEVFIPRACFSYLNEAVDPVEFFNDQDYTSWISQ